MNRTRYPVQNLSRIPWKGRDQNQSCHHRVDPNTNRSIFPTIHAHQVICWMLRPSGTQASNSTQSKIISSPFDSLLNVIFVLLCFIAPDSHFITVNQNHPFMQKRDSKSFDTVALHINQLNDCISAMGEKTAHHPLNYEAFSNGARSGGVITTVVGPTDTAAEVSDDMRYKCVMNENAHRTNDRNCHKQLPNAPSAEVSTALPRKRRV